MGKGQGTPEYLVVASFILIVFIIISFIVYQKENESYDFKVSLDAKKVANSIADNINTISQQGEGYYRYFYLPEYLYSSVEYEITASEGYVIISWNNLDWATPVISNNATILHLDKGGENNCVFVGDGGTVVSDVCNASNAGCGEVHECDPLDSDNCALCDSPTPPSILQNSISNCDSYGCNTSEWHFYSLVPQNSGTLTISFSGTGTMSDNARTDLMFFDYDASGCLSPQQVFNLESSTETSFEVIAGNNYVIALDSDSPNCGQGGSYTLQTILDY